VAVLLIAGSLYGIANGWLSGDQETPAPPNILVVVTDDQPTGMVRRMPFLSTAPGVTRFNSYYVNNPLCCPTRTTLLTGLYSHHTGVETNLVADRFDDSSTLATWLDARGYETGLFGKYLNDYPWDKGQTYVPPGWDSWSAFAGDAGYYDYTLVSPGGRTHYGHRPGDYSTDVLADLTAEFMHEAEAPFFAYFAPYGPHAPRRPAPRHRAAYMSERVTLPANFNQPADGTPEWWRTRPAVDPREMREETRAQWRTLLSVDDALGRFFSVMREIGELESTIVIYTSDNGYSLGSHRNRLKDCPYEECIHVPLLVRWPGRTTVPEINALTGSVDVAPTIAEMAGASASPRPDGTSLVPLLTGQSSSLDRPVLLRHVRYPRTAPSFWGIRTENWMYAVYETGERELYDLIRDPFELDNLAGRPAYESVEHELSERMKELRRG
jgi:N-acetylglucosamine-6-sulfatase